jgi:hypothetical protein
VARDTVRQHIWSGTIVYWRRADRQIVVQGG